MSQAIWQARMLRLPLIWATLTLISLRLLARLGVLLNSKMILVTIGFHCWLLAGGKLVFARSADEC